MSVLSFLNGKEWSQQLNSFLANTPPVGRKHSNNSELISAFIETLNYVKRFNINSVSLGCPYLFGFIIQWGLARSVAAGRD